MRHPCVAVSTVCTLLFVAACHDAGRPAFSPLEPAPRTPASFRAAKREVMRIHEDWRVTFYCGCGFTLEKAVLSAGCGYAPRNDNVRAHRIEIEHVVPAHAFGAHRTCWTQALCSRRDGRTFKGRRCCRKIDEEFRRMEADLQNLVPAVGELNADRSNFTFGDVPGEPRAYGACAFEVDRGTQLAEPATGIRGDIARIYLYMYRAYPDGLPLTREELARLRGWHRADPPDAWERTRNERVAAIQGVGNPWVP